jgi:hypothetical protein
MQSNIKEYNASPIVVGNQKQIMREIENKSMKQVEDAYITSKIQQNTSYQNMRFAHSIISSGSDDFVKRVGREPTYSELREMFG